MLAGVSIFQDHLQTNIMDDDIASFCEVHIPAKTTTAAAAVVVKGGGRGRKKRQRTVVPAGKDGSSSVSSSSTAINSFSVADWERRRLFQEQWAAIEAKLLAETSTFFRKYVQLLYDFIERSTGGTAANYHPQVGFNYGQLPVAMIALNSKMTQTRIHAEVEEMLTAAAANSSNIHRLCLNSFNCASMSSLLQALFNGLISDEVCEENDLDGSHWKNMSFDEVLKLWFDSNNRRGSSSSFKSRHPPSLVLFVFDFESVNRQTLLNLILLLKEHVHQAAISLVFFLASQHTGRSLQYYLPAQATDHLAVEALEPFNETALIPRLLEALVTDERLHFRLHPSMLRQLVDHTASYEFNFAALILLLKSLVFDYFYANPLSVVCQEPRSEELKATLAGNRRLLKLLQNSLPLASEAAEEGDNNDKEEDDDHAYISRLTDQLEALNVQHCRFTLTLQVTVDLLLQTIYTKSTKSSNLPSVSSKAFLAVYADSLTNSAYNFEEQLLAELLDVPESAWKSALRRLLTKYQGLEAATDLLALFTDYQGKLTDLLRQQAEETARQQAANRKLGLEIDMVASSVTVVKEKLRAVHSRAEWRQTLKSQPTAKRRSLLPFEQWRADLVAAMAEVLKAASPLTNFGLLVEALFYRNGEHFRSVHCVCTRDRLARTLGGQNLVGRSFARCYPNSFILYQLYREAAPLVNLADWYQAFGEEKGRQGLLIQDQKGSRSKKKKKGSKESAADSDSDSVGPLSTDELTVHFSTTLSDFDYIGLLQSSRVKADYLNRLAWF